MTAGPIIIRKYGNRRLYDTTSSRYVNLEEVAAMIRKGSDVQVVDAKTGEDLTRVVLTQIITEDAKGQPAGLPVELLRQMILATDHARQEFLTWYLRTAFETYHKLQETVQSRLTDVGSAAFAPFQKMRSLISSALAPEAAEAEPASEVEVLRRRVAELEARLNEVSDAKKPRKKTRAARKRTAGS